MVDDLSKSLAAQISADPAFTALEASGAPIVALVGEEPRIVYANATAAAMFGERPDARLFLGPEGGEERLGRLLERLKRNSAPRLERLPLALAGEARTVTALCRRLAGPPATPIYVVAALGLRPPAPADDEETAKNAEAAGAADRDAWLRDELRSRFGGAARFLWKTDALGRFVEVTHELADVAGRANADILGRRVDDVARTLGLGPALAEAFASRRTWSGVEVDWPLDEPPAAAPTTLGALPIFDATRRFAGFRGFGVLRLDRATARDARTPRPASPTAERQPDPSPARVDNIVPLRPPAPTPREEPAAPPQSALTPIEKTAFDEIGRALASAPPPPPGPARELIDHVARALETPHSGQADDASSRSALIDMLPIGVLVARGEEALYANRTLLSLLGFADLDALARSGELSRAFAGRLPARPAPPRTVALRAVEVVAPDGELLHVEAHVQNIAWEGAPATLICLRRRQLQPVAAAAPAAELERDRLIAASAELQTAFDLLPDALAMATAEGRIARANAACARFFAKAGPALQGRELSSLFAGEDGRRIASFFAGSDASAELRLEGGERLWLRRTEGEPKRVLCRLEQSAPQAGSTALQEAREAAERASAAKSEFLARVSHEIRTPLSAILGFAEVMMEERFGPIGSERYKEYLKDVHASGAHVLSIVNDLLDLSKIEAGKMELSADEVDVNAVIGECVSIMQTQASKLRVIVRLSLAPRLPRIRADERSLRQILLNLLSNAVKFNVPGGQVIVSSAQTDAGYVVVRVKDTGVGMTNDEIALALEPFKQLETARKSGGTGLGLPVTKALVEANHATLLIQSRKNEGTLIEVGFPPRQDLAAE
ncbi:MAG TPA: ATP-binding protein [Methylocystis sp.]|nr:ATP-binding protein [Methylocystis sp.]